MNTHNGHATNDYSEDDAAIEAIIQGIYEDGVNQIVFEFLGSVLARSPGTKSMVISTIVGNAKDRIKEFEDELLEECCPDCRGRFKRKIDEYSRQMGEGVEENVTRVLTPSPVGQLLLEALIEKVQK